MHDPHDHANHPHDHPHPPGADAMLRAAEATCLRNGARLTTQRRHVLEALIESEKPLGAYDLIEAMRQKTGRGPAPIAIYRALDFLKEQGFIHRLETLNAFIACPHHHEQSEPVVFLICEDCRSVSEATAEPLAGAIRSVAATRGFIARRQVMELAGLCRVCQSAPGVDP